LQLTGYKVQDAPNPFGGRLYAVPTTGSTMEDARELVLSGAVTGPDSADPSGAGAVLRCDFQTAGRGQGPNRSWTAPPGSSLMFTLCLPESWIPAPREALPLRMALGLAWFLEERRYAGVEVKWPNDLLLGGKKVAGILCHHAANWFFVGMGLNVNQRRFPPDLRAPATSLALAGGETGRGEALDPGTLLSPLLAHLRRALDAVDWRRALDQRLAGVGDRVILKEGGAGSGASGARGPHSAAPGSEAVPGVVLGIGETGALRVRRSDTGDIDELFTRDRIEWLKKI
jgi:BirA family transcriptional regulator, biotin operon repressor / biotin---[acetyl-CoA-carboxylase] ligase